jgi:hypothetical protein
MYLTLYGNIYYYIYLACSLQKKTFSFQFLENFVSDDCYEIPKAVLIIRKHV